MQLHTKRKICGTLLVWYPEQTQFSQPVSMFESWHLSISNPVSHGVENRASILDSFRCGIQIHQRPVWRKTIREHSLKNPDIAREMTIATYKTLVKKYLESFSNYSKLLRPQIGHWIRLLNNHWRWLVEAIGTKHKQMKCLGIYKKPEHE